VEKVTKHSSSKPGGSAPSPRADGPIRIKIEFGDFWDRFDLSPSAPFIEAIQKKRQTRLLCLFFDPAAMLTPPMMEPFERMVIRMGKVDKLDVFLRSTGGITEVPWHIVSLLREFCDQLGVIVAQRALSGATHIAIAADELVMTATARLGSVDPTRQHPLLPKDVHGQPIPVSVEQLKQCVKFIQEQLGESYLNQNLALIVSELFKYIDPLALGALEQSYNLSKLITRKCLQTRNVPLGEKHIEQIVEMLASNYYSHGFLISRADVKSDLKLPVIYPENELSADIAELDEFYLKQFQLGTGVETQGASLRFVGVMQVGPAGFKIAQVRHPSLPNVIEAWHPFDFGGEP
jgi:hypothetical protein